ncbi:MAG: aldehyde dehydrogenase family protein, partial [Solirubrobacterales bacterium]
MGEPITDLLIAGRPAPGEGAPIEVENPATEQVAATVSSASPGQVDQAVAAAGEAFEEWSRMPALKLEMTKSSIERAKVLAGGDAGGRETGHFLEPTVVVDVPGDAALMT